jgi:hypothetical protein
MDKARRDRFERLEDHYRGMIASLQPNRIETKKAAGVNHLRMVD